MRALWQFLDDPTAWSSWDWAILIGVVFLLLEIYYVLTRRTKK